MAREDSEIAGETMAAANWRRELRTMLALAVPVVLAELGWMAQGVVDTIMVGKLGPAAIGAALAGDVQHVDHRAGGRLYAIDQGFPYRIAIEMDQHQGQ